MMQYGKNLTTWQRSEMDLCSPGDESGYKVWENVPGCLYFINEYVQIYDEGKRDHIPFELWPAQIEMLELIMSNGRICILKARQLGLTWLALAYGLWQVVFMPGLHIGLYSYTLEESETLLDKMKQMYDRLPSWMVAHLQVKLGSKVKDRKTLWTFTNNNRVRALSCTRADSYQFTYVVVDEATLIPNLRKLLRRLLPTINSVSMGRLVMIAVASKEDPLHYFNDTWRSADTRWKTDREMVVWEDWVPVFLPWWQNPNFTKAKYNDIKKGILDQEGNLDALYEMYPATSAEALAPATANKRLLQTWVIGCYEKLDPIMDGGYEMGEEMLAPYTVLMYKRPEAGRRYVIGCDTAEGLPTSDDSVTVCVDFLTGEECAIQIGKMTPEDQAHDANLISIFYNNAPILVERNNHGHTLIRELVHLDGHIMDGLDDRAGYLQGPQSKIQLYDNLAGVLKSHVESNQTIDGILVDIEVDGNHYKGLMHTNEVSVQLMSIERNTLKAPPKHHDDMAVAYAVAQMARTLDVAEGVQPAEYWSF